jgi:hypothetical protein
MLIRSESNPDSKGLWQSNLIDNDYATLDLGIVISSNGRSNPDFEESRSFSK